MHGVLCASLVATCVGAASAGGAPPARAVAVTFDDLPFTSQRKLDVEDRERLTRRLLDSIDEHGVPAVGFVNEKKLYHGDRQDPREVALLQRWLDAGLELGNHTFSHPDLHRVPLSSFEDEIVRGALVTRGLLARADRELVWFRHPFLHTGLDLETKRAVEGFLAERGYRVAPVTIDNSEWIFARAYDLAREREDESMQRRVTEAYLPYIERYFEYYETQSRALVGREIPQVLLLHANELNAETFSRLARKITERGYAFVSLAHVLEDAAYALPDTYTGPGGISWLHRWALTRGESGEFFRGEPEVPAFVADYAGIDQR